MSILLFKTVNILAFSAYQGLLTSLFGTSLLDLAETFDTNIEQVSYLSFTCTVGTLFGCLAVSWVYRNSDSQLVIIGLILVKGFAKGAIPFMSSLWGAHAMSLIYGLSLGVLEPGVYMWLISLYSRSQKCSALLQTFHLMHATGSLLGSMMIRPFVSPRNHLLIPEAAQKTQPKSQIHYAYLICAALSVVLSASACLSYILEGNSSEKIVQTDKNKNQVTPVESAKTSLVSEGHVLTIQVGLHCLLFVSIFSCFSRYLSIYAVLLGMSKDEGVVLISKFYSMAMLSRLLCIIPVGRIRPKIFLIAVDLIFLISTGMFLYFGSQTKTYLTISIIALGMACGPIYAAGTAFLVNRVSKLEHSHTSILKFMSNCGGLVPPLAVGPIIENSPQIFPEVIVTSAAMLLMVALFVANRKHFLKGDRLSDCTLKTISYIEHEPLLTKIM